MFFEWIFLHLYPLEISLLTIHFHYISFSAVGLVWIVILVLTEVRGRATQLYGLEVVIFVYIENIFIGFVMNLEVAVIVKLDIRNLFVVNFLYISRIITFKELPYF